MQTETIPSKWINVTRAATILDVSNATVREWARAILAGEALPERVAAIRSARRKPNGYYQLKLDEVQAARKASEQTVEGATTQVSVGAEVQ